MQHKAILSSLLKVHKLTLSFQKIVKDPCIMAFKNGIITIWEMFAFIVRLPIQFPCYSTVQWENTALSNMLYIFSSHQQKLCYLWITEIMFLHRLIGEPNQSQELLQPSFHPLEKHLVEANLYLGRYTIIHLFCLGHAKNFCPYCSCCGGAYINSSIIHRSSSNGGKTCHNKSIDLGMHFLINFFRFSKSWWFWCGYLCGKLIFLG